MIFFRHDLSTFTGREKVLCFSTLDKKIDYKKQVMFLLIYVTCTPAIFFNFQVKRDGRESNRATNLSPPPRLKMTDIKQNPKNNKEE